MKRSKHERVCRHCSVCFTRDPRSRALCCSAECARLLHNNRKRITPPPIQDNDQYIMIPIPMLLWCPKCGARHIDEGEFATRKHTSHACQSCGLVWRPAIVETVGVRFLPGSKNEVTE